ncbi:four-carbon acid sugar kinase family protein [Streptomyces sp. NBC_01795]|uniref:3-oxo-tetronate kinase n=1 Tax=unclassified Streptomyces TaxID=2593676 RepID=UPI002DD9A5AD|nr:MULTISPECIES: 3-oxo-tetronate kinase [unclassified Streptomyces]WSA95963.1 four-carbon acid sugar kinase family protein [Streptomyces sp. NBC_01795]WSB80379.1 four-carbon acid sugar kinase family protein [Streptomyces sp. NBC_01775]
MPILGAIADDFTGATDLATMLVARGFRTEVTVGPPDPAALRAAGEGPSGVDAVVVALKSRTAPVETAVRDSVSALRALRAAGCARFYFKYCSTFDSTPQGNIGPVTDALLDELGERHTVVVPSFPATGRTVYRSRLFVHDDLLDESPMRDHPLTPMHDAHLGRLLAPQTRRAVHALPHETVRAGAAAVRAVLAEPACQNGLIVADATTDDDLRVLAAATDELPLVTGAAGLALGLTGPRPDAESARARAAEAGPSARGAVLSGSASAATRAQVAHGRAHLPHRKLDLGALRDDFEAAVAALTGFAVHCWRDDPSHPPLIYAVGEESDVERSAPGADDGGSPAELVERALARCAVGLVRAGATRLLVAGGETSGAVVTALGIHTLRMGAPLGPGVSWATAEPRAREGTQPGAGTRADAGGVGTGAQAGEGPARRIDLALKSGNFGATDLFTSAWDALA